MGLGRSKAGEGGVWGKDVAPFLYLQHVKTADEWIKYGLIWMNKRKNESS